MARVSWWLSAIKPSLILSAKTKKKNFSFQSALLLDYSSGRGNSLYEVVRWSPANTRTKAVAR